MKHAYLIIAHNEPYILRKIIECVDDKRNDIFIHIDKKCNLDTEINFKEICKYSRIFVFKEIDVNWGDKSQVECEILLLKMATNQDNYRYLHIISGVDMPIKSQNYIHSFFEKYDGKEFVHYDNKNVSKGDMDRVLHKHIFTKSYKKGNKIFVKMKFISDDLFIKFQKLFGIKKSLPYQKVQKGCNWCSITGELANYIISEENNIKKLIEKSKCADEIFIQTIVENSSFSDNLYIKEKNNDYNACLRFIVWDKTNKKTPKTIILDDFEKIKQSNMLFARKFNSSADKKIIDKIYDYVKNEVVK